MASHNGGQAVEQARWVQKIYESMTTFQAGFHEAGEPANPAIQNPINIFKRISVASENVWSALFIEHHFLSHAKTVNGKYLAVVNTPHISSSSSDLIHKRLTTWTDMWSTEWIVQQLRALAYRKKRREEVRNKNGNAPPTLHLNTPQLCPKFPTHLRQVSKQFVQWNESSNNWFTWHLGNWSNSEDRQTRNTKKNDHDSELQNITGPSSKQLSFKNILFRHLPCMNPNTVYWCPEKFSVFPRKCQYHRRHHFVDGPESTKTSSKSVGQKCVPPSTFIFEDAFCTTQNIVQTYVALNQIKWMLVLHYYRCS